MPGRDHPRLAPVRRPAGAPGGGHGTTSCSSRRPRRSSRRSWRSGIDRPLIAADVGARDRSCGRTTRWRAGTLRQARGLRGAATAAKAANLGFLAHREVLGPRRRPGQPERGARLRPGPAGLRGAAAGLPRLRRASAERRHPRRSSTRSSPTEQAGELSPKQRAPRVEEVQSRDHGRIVPAGGAGTRSGPSSTRCCPESRRSRSAPAPTPRTSPTSTAPACMTASPPTPTSAIARSGPA